MEIFEPSQFDPNLLYSDGFYTDSELKIIRIALGSLRATYPRFTEKHRHTYLSLHSSAQLNSTVHVAGKYSLECIDVELLRLMDFFTDCVNSADHLDYKGLRNQIVDRIIFHAGVRSGRFFQVDRLPAQLSYRNIQNTDGSQKYFFTGLLFMLSHETCHIDCMLDPSAHLFSRQQLGWSESRGHFSVALRWGLHPKSLLERLHLDHRIDFYSSPFDKLQLRDDSWLTELHADFIGIAIAVGHRQKFGIDLLHAVGAVMGLQFTQLALDIVSIFVQAPGLVSRETANVIIRASERTLASVVNIASIVMHTTPTAIHEETVDRVRNVALRNFEMVQQIAASSQVRIASLSPVDAMSISEATRVVKRWGYDCTRVSKLVVAASESNWGA